MRKPRHQIYNKLYIISPCDDSGLETVYLSKSKLTLKLKKTTWKNHREMLFKNKKKSIIKGYNNIVENRL